MFEIVKAGGIMMGPLILASIIVAAIFLERLWTLQSKRVLPAELTQKVWRWVEQRQIQDKHIVALQQNSPLGKILAAGLLNRYRDRAVIRESIEDTGRHVAAPTACDPRQALGPESFVRGWCPGGSLDGRCGVLFT